MTYVETTFVGGISAQYEPAFVDAAAFWGNIIQHGHSGYTFDANFDTQACGVSHVFQAGHHIAGLAILSQVAPIDGTGGILGQAGPCYLHEGIPFMGVMKFDSTDVQALLESGQFGSVIKHEMGHVVGIGSLWTYFEFVRNPCNNNSFFCNTNPTYVGAHGLEGFHQLGGSGDLLVADENGPGTWNAHWREGEFDNELMTGFLNSASPNPMSIMSVMSLMDLGYVVDTSTAEEYFIPSQFARPLGGVNFRLQGEMLDFDLEEITDAVARKRDNEASNEDYEIFSLAAFMLVGFVMLAGAMFYSAKQQKKQIALLATASRGRSVRQDKK